MALWTPANLTSVTLEGWYRLRDPAGILADGSDLTLSGSNVTAWADRSGNSRTLANSGTPTYSATGLDGTYPGVTSAFGGDGLRTAAGAGYPSSAVIGSMAVCFTTTNGRISSLNASGQQDFGSSGFIPLFQSGGDILYWYNFATATAVHANSTNVAILEGVPLSTTTADVGANTVLSGTPITITGVTLDRMGLFAESDSGGNGPAGSIAENVLWAGVISTTELQKLEGYIAWNNGQQALLPGGHPYVSAAPTTGGAGSQSLTPSLYDDGDTFFSALVSRGSVTLTPSLFSDGDTFFAPAVTSSASLTPALFTDGDTFFGPVLTVGAVTLQPSLFTDADTFFSSTVSRGDVTLIPSLLTDADTFYAAAVTAQITLTPQLFTDPDVFYSPTLTGGTPVIGVGDDWLTVLIRRRQTVH